MSAITLRTILTAGAMGAISAIFAVPGLPVWVQLALAGVGGVFGGWAHLPQPGAK